MRPPGCIRYLRRTCLVVVAVAIWAATALPAGAVAELGVFRGGGNVSMVSQFGTWLGRYPTHVLDFFARQSWSDISSPTWFLQQWQTTPYEMEFSVAMLPEAVPGVTLQQGASGAYDSHFTALAQKLVQHGYGDAIIRLGWEFNGDWYVWAAAQDPVSWVAYWRRIVDAMRAVPGTSFRFDWCPILGGGVPLEQLYPGDAYVDYIGLDVYDVDWLPGNDDVEKRWAHLVHQPYGLLWHRDFARAHGKPMTFPEWGVWEIGTHPYAGGDNPYFIERMYEWVHQEGVAYHMYFEFDAHDGDHELEGPTLFPQSAARFRDLFRTAPAVPTVPSIPPNDLAPTPAPPRDPPAEEPGSPPDETPGPDGGPPDSQEVPAPVSHERADDPATPPAIEPDGGSEAAEEDGEIDVAVSGISEGATVSTRPLVTVSVAEPSAVRHVAFYVDGRKLCHRVAEPFSCRPRLQVGPQVVSIVTTMRRGLEIERELRVRASQRLRARAAVGRINAHAA